jgi:hypothetical protein
MLDDWVVIWPALGIPFGMAEALGAESATAPSAAKATAANLSFMEVSLFRDV